MITITFTIAQWILIKTIGFSLISIVILLLIDLFLNPVSLILEYMCVTAIVLSLVCGIVLFGTYL